MIVRLLNWWFGDSCRHVNKGRSAITHRSGDVVEYWSRKKQRWTSTQVESVRHKGGRTLYDLKCKKGAEASHVRNHYKIGDAVEYWNGELGKWTPAKITQVSEQEDIIQLDNSRIELRSHVRGGITKDHVEVKATSMPYGTLPQLENFSLWIYLILFGISVGLVRAFVMYRNAYDMFVNRSAELPIDTLAASNVLTKANACSSIEYGVSGKWAISGDSSIARWLRRARYPMGLPTSRPLEWVDDACGRLPHFDERYFCVDSLKCQNMLLVGDSTTAQVYEVLVMALYGPSCAPYMNRDIVRRCGTLRCEVCQMYCNTSVILSYIRHNHLIGRHWGPDPRDQCDHWREPEELQLHHHLFLSSGSHVNDDPYLRRNTGHVWEAWAAELIDFLQREHPHNVMWRTSWYGLFSWQKFPCPNASLIRDTPLPYNEISDQFDNSWRNISDYNRVTKSQFLAKWPGLLILDVEAMLSMRGDCRSDFLHFHLGNHSEACALWFMPRILQSFMSSA